MWDPNSTASALESPLGANPATPFTTRGARHISVAGQAVVTASYAIGVAGNAAALAILSRSETARNRKQTLMLRCLAWNDLIALLGMLVQMHLTLYPPSSLYLPRVPTDLSPPTPSPLLEDLGSSEGWSEGTPSWEAVAPSSANLLLHSTASREALFEAESPEDGIEGTDVADGIPGSTSPTRTPLPSMGTAHFLCVLRVVWRLFGLGSGCVAIVMAVERWIALTRPFLYQKVGHSLKLYHSYD
ncbi:hypothetical protein J437_LFUL016592 [Ladona fulva]|uniref:G-protein coupled receptors family 1 profile domain-containing protein n=1 Tax=Ladona fulva TaxID=123851 RepID=A0A8K0JWH2_LADFU|nr:hypothetical protein J437_LFUL016592 [Ladona fulva]